MRGDAGFAGLPTDAQRPSGRGATERTLVDDLPAGRAELALDLVRDTGALPEHMRRHGLVTV
jgi:hypothetical protein